MRFVTDPSENRIAWVRTCRKDLTTIIIIASVGSNKALAIALPLDKNSNP